MLPQNWESPTIQSITEISQLIAASSLNETPLGCDISPVNLFLYRNKYNTEICYQHNCLIRRFNEKGFIYYGFPIVLNNSQPEADSLINALAFIKQDAEKCGSNGNVFFGTEDLIKPLEDPCELAHCHDTLGVPESGIQSVQDRDLADYLYLQKNLSELSGSKYSKKRGHINQFLKKHPDCSYTPLSSQNLSLAMDVEKAWLEEMSHITEISVLEDLKQEELLINQALENFVVLDLHGGIVMCNEQPVAMCISSKINSVTTDVHFEKAIGLFAHDGAYAFINREYAKCCETCFINREEDLGFENLRKAKLSYYPDLLLRKSILTLK